MSHLIVRHSGYLTLVVGFLISLVLGAEFELISATRSEPRTEKLHLDELVLLSALFSFGLAILSVLSGKLAWRERRQRAAVEHSANVDPLTGIANRRLFFERLEAAFARSRSGCPCAVILLDLDGFKAINDGYGHAAGDCVLVHVARQIDSVKSCGCLAARLGGDEFALIVEGSAAGASQVEALVGRLHEAIAEPVNHGGTVFTVGSSVGAAYASEAIASPAALLDAADGEMYRIKRRGRPPIAA